MFFSSKIFKTFIFWIFLITLIFHAILYIMYFKTGINPILNYAVKEVKKYHYDIEENETINTDDNLNQKQNNNINAESDRKKINEENLTNIEKKRKKLTIIVF